MGVRRSRVLAADWLHAQRVRGESGEVRGGLLRLHPDRAGDDEAWLGASFGEHLLRRHGRRQVGGLEVEVLLERGDELGEVEPVGVRRLLEQVVATHEVLGALVSELGDDPLDLHAHRLEEAGAALGGGHDLLRRELLEAMLLRLLDGLDLGRDPDVAGVELAAAADRAAERDHRQGPEGDAVRAHAEELHDVVGMAVAAVGPDLDPVADPGLHQRPVHGAGADVGGQADVAQCVLAGGAGPALEAGQRDDVGAGLGDAEADRADVRHHRDLDRDPHVGVDGLQLVDQLGQVLDRVEVVVVGGRDEVGARGGVSGRGDLLGDLLARQVPALARLGPLPDFDLRDV